ncbi:hypothetical protein F5Y17DRAFT_472671 [Xylariaceae sp. FL0594]|nr:hypothetical protein F5Y17DRAFT_472671 [Xylariaceae sp. FL0594]
MSTPTKGPGQQPADTLSPPKRRQTGYNDNGPIITSTLEPHANKSSKDRDVLDGQKEELRQDLLEELEDLSARMQRVQTKAARERIADEQQDIIAAIGVLVAIDDDEWEDWVTRRKEKPIGSLDRYISSFGRTTREIIDLWMQRTDREETREELQDREVRDGDKTQTFFRKLAGFWPQDKVAQLQSFVKEPGHVPQNLIVLSSDAHKDWTNAKFALQPQHHSSSKLVLEFVWLASTQPREGTLYNRGMRDTTALIYQGPSATPTSDPTLYVLRSGDRIIVESSDPAEAPLPLWELLQLQWDMQRISRACAAADVLAACFGRQGPPVAASARAKENDVYYEESNLPVGPDTTIFTKYILDEAVEQKILEQHDPREVEEYFLSHREDEDDLLEEACPADLEDTEVSANRGTQVEN